MAEAIGAVGAVAQLIHYGITGANGIYDVTTRARSAPKTLQHWLNEIQGFLDLAKELEAEAGNEDSEARKSAQKFGRDINALKLRLQGLLAHNHDGRVKRYRNVAKLVLKETKFSRMLSTYRHTSDGLHNNWLRTNVRDIKDQVENLSFCIQYLLLQDRLAASQMASTNLSSSVGVPFRFTPHANPCFIGQTEKVSLLLEGMKPELDRTRDTGPFVLVGPSGSGKTEMAREVLLKLQSRITNLLILWLDGSQAEEFQSKCDNLLIPVLRTLTRRSYSLRRTPAQQHDQIDDLSWLLVVDNAHRNTFGGGASSLLKSISDVSGGNLLVISRDRLLIRQIGAQVHSINAEGMTVQDGCQLFRSRGPCDHLPQDQVEALVLALDCLPNGIIAAAQYLRRYPIGISEYLEELEKGAFNSDSLIDPARMLSEETKPGILISALGHFEELRKINKRAFELFSNLSLLHRRNIPLSVLHDMERRIGNTDAISVLADLHFIKPSKKGSTFNLHTWSQFLLRSGQIEGIRNDDMLVMLLGILGDQFPTSFNDQTTILQGRRYMRHISSLITIIVSVNLTMKMHKDDWVQISLLTRRLLRLWIDLGLYNQAKATSESMLTLNNQQPVFPIDFSSMLSSKLAMAEYCCGRMQTISSILGSGFRIAAPIHIKCDIDVIQGLNTLALAYQSQGNLDKALDLHREVIAARERLFGREHRNTLPSLTNLALCFQAQKQHATAEVLLRRVLERRLLELGTLNLLTLKSMSNLSTSLQLQRRYSEAEHYCREAITGSEQLLGSEHPDILRRKYNLIIILSYRNSKTAEDTYRDLVAAFERKLGLDHPETIMAYENLAVFLREESRFDEAEMTIRRILPAVVRQYGKGHAKTLGVMHHLAILLQHQQEYEEAFEIATEVLHSRTDKLGDQHLDTQKVARHVEDLRSYLVRTTDLAVSDPIECPRVEKPQEQGSARRFALQREHDRSMPFLFVLLLHLLAVLAFVVISWCKAPAKPGSGFRTWNPLAAENVLDPSKKADRRRVSDRSS